MIDSGSRFSWKSVGEQTLAGLLVAALLGLGALVRASLQGVPVLDTLGRFRELALAPVSVPMWLVSVVALIAIPALASVVRLTVLNRRDDRGAALRERLSADEEALIELFGEYDDPRLPLDLVRTKLGLSQLRFDETIALLEARRFVFADRQGYTSSNTVSLEARGRSWLLAGKSMRADA